MPSYDVHGEGVARARELIDAGDYDDTTEWSEAAPSTERTNEEIERNGHDGWGAWHLAVDPDAGEDTKKRYHFPYGDYEKVNRAALIHAKQRASQNDHPGIEKVADELLQRLDARRG